jgi:hypothetical protein
VSEAVLARQFGNVLARDIIVIMDKSQALILSKSPEPLDVVGIVRKMQKVRKELNIE